MGLIGKRLMLIPPPRGGGGFIGGGPKRWGGWKAYSGDKDIWGRLGGKSNLNNGGWNEVVWGDEDKRGGALLKGGEWVGGSLHRGGQKPCTFQIRQAFPP